MPTPNEVKRDRLNALRMVRKAERAVDTKLEVLERRIYRLLDRKTVIQYDSANAIVPLYEDFVAQIRNLEQAITDFLIICST